MKKAKHLIVLFVPAEKLVNGGILSIFSICKVSREFEAIHKSQVVLSALPGVKSYGRNDLFENDEVVHDFEEIVKLGSPESLLLHIPEVASFNTFMALKKYHGFLKAIPNLRINILNQNILLMQPPEEVALWFALTPNVTQTTGHNRYSTQQLADDYAMPVHHLSTYIDHSQYEFVPNEKKKPIIALSHDQSELRGAIEKKLGSELPKYKVVTINNLTYEEYKKFIGEAKYIVTFGEGFDGYYVEGFFTGGITFAVYNAEFFPDDSFADFPNTYKTEADMLRLIVADIKKLDEDEAAYKKINKQNFDKINSLYSFSTYKNNIKLFYEQKYTYLPAKDSIKHLLGRFISQSEKDRSHDRSELVRLRQAVADMEKMIAEKSQSIKELDAKIQEMEQSKSWKVTKPLRKVSSIGKRPS